MVKSMHIFSLIILQYKKLQESEVECGKKALIKVTDH